MRTPAPSSFALLSFAIAITACETPKPHPEIVTSVPPAAATSNAPVATASASTTPAAPQATPPEPGRVELTFTGDFDKQVSSEGAECDHGGFWIRSNDVVGHGTKPRWVLVHRENGLQLQLGPFDTARVFNSPESAAPQIKRDKGELSFDVELIEREKGKGKVRARGKVICAKPTSGTVPDAIAKILRDEAGSPLRERSTQDFGRESMTAGVSVIVPGEPDGKARDLVLRLRKRLPPGWVAFVGTSRWLGEEKLDGNVEVVVGPGRDQFDILRLAKTDAVNYEMSTEALVKKLRAYHAIVPIDIWHAETDTIELDLAAVPADPKAFAKDVYAFCPDIVDQGVGSVAALEKEIVKTKRLFLWWD